MDKPIVGVEKMIELPFPLRGMDISSEYDLQPALTTPEAVNVRGYEPIGKRDRGGQRPGLSQYLGQLPNGAHKIQHLNFIVDPQATALISDLDFDDPNVRYEYIDDPSTNNLKTRNPPGRRVRRRGSGRQPNKNLPAGAKKNPIITWADAADIWLGTALGAELNAQATDPSTFLAVPGVFTYSPPAGTFLGVHTTQPQDLGYTFTPTNTTVYNVVGPAIGSHITVRGIYLVNHTSPGSFTVQTGDLVLIGAGTTHSVDGVTVTVSDGSNTYTQIGGYVRGDDGVTFRAASLWYFIAGSPGTITVTVTPSAGGVDTVGQGHFRGVLGADSSSSGSGSGAGEAFTAGVCPVNFDDEMIATFSHPNPGSIFKPGYSTNGTLNIFTNVTTASGMDTGPAAPVGGTSVATDTVLSGNAAAPWAMISASFTHRIS